jgi:hypothetical protein
MIGVVLIGLAWIYNEYAPPAFWIGVVSVVLIAVWVERYSTRRPSRMRLSPDPVNRACRRLAHNPGLVRRASRLHCAGQDLSRTDRGRVKAGRQSLREQRAVQAHLLREPHVTLDLCRRK